MTREEYKQKVLRAGITRHNAPKKQQTARSYKYPQKYFKAKECKMCGSLFVPKAPSELYCSDECKDYGIVEAYYKRTYGISLEEYLDVAEKQNFVCAICHRENFPMGDFHTGVLVVDHDHNTGNVRGLLCHNCNRALGLLNDSKETLENCLSYLESVTTNCTRKRVEAVGTSE